MLLLAAAPDAGAVGWLAVIPLLRAALLKAARLPAGTVSAGARGLGVRLGGRPVVDGVDLCLEPGLVVALVGPNGAGKSTLLSAVAGDLVPAHGTVEIDGRPPSAWSAVELAMRRAVLPQHHLLSFPFPVGDVVRMGRAPWAGTDRADLDDDLVAAAMDATGVFGLADRPFSALSGGERARVALARVLAQATGVLLLDEPTAALDLRHQELVLRVARDRAALGTAVLVVLHDLGLAAAHADRVLVLAAGRPVAFGTPAEVLTAELLTTVYEHEIEVFPHPRTGVPLIVPVR